MIQSRMTKSGRRIVIISQDQVDNLAGNCYEVIGEDRRSKIIISTRSVTHGAPFIHVTCNSQSMGKLKHGPEVCVGGGG